jgi:hypothetical protein
VKIDGTLMGKRGESREIQSKAIQGVALEKSGD